MTRLIQLMAVLVLSTLEPIAANAQSYGLGVSTEVRLVSSSSFGLGSSKVASTFLPATPQPVAQPRPAAVFEIIVRRARLSWTDRTVGTWTDATLRRHLLGELASPEHRGRVSAAQLAGRSLRELQDIHDNLHEGYSWNGTVTTTTMTTRAVQVSSGNCPGGVCPTPQRAPVRRIFRR